MVKYFIQQRIRKRAFIILLILIMIMRDSQLLEESIIEPDEKIKTFYRLLQSRNEDVQTSTTLGTIQPFVRAHLHRKISKYLIKELLPLKVI
jgi:hypothetical protein